MFCFVFMVFQILSFSFSINVPFIKSIPNRLQARGGYSIFKRGEGEGDKMV